MNTFKKRIDELGRIVIPKQIRNNFKINNFDEVELFVDKEYIIIKKSIGIELFKEKLERLLSLLNDVLSFKIIITDKNNVVVSNYEGIEYRNEFLLESNNGDFVETPKIKGYIEHYPIIIDSNTLGKIYFVSNIKFDNSKDLLKKIRDLVIDVII